MQKVMFFNFDDMGLGGLWQNISWLLKHQNDDLEINLHLDDNNTQRFLDIFDCFAKSKYPVKIKKHDSMHFENNRNHTWHVMSNIIRQKIVDSTDYQLYQIQTLSCTMWHDYYPVKYASIQRDHICVYLHYKEQTYDDDNQSFGTRNLTEAQTAYVYDKLKNKNVITLGGDLTIKENCRAIVNSKYVLGREGGWTHVAHSCKKDFYPVMNNNHPFLLWCHGGHNKYLKPYTHVDNIESLLNEIDYTY